MTSLYFHEDYNYQGVSQGTDSIFKTLELGGCGFWLKTIKLPVYAILLLGIDLRDDNLLSYRVV